MSYKLKCFNCGERFYSKEEVYRNEGKPYCGECMSGLEYPYEGDYDEEADRDKAYVRKYGEC